MTKLGDKLGDAGVVPPRDKLNELVEKVLCEHPEAGLDVQARELALEVQRGRDFDVALALCCMWEWSLQRLCETAIRGRQKDTAGNPATEAKRPHARRVGERDKASGGANTSAVPSLPNQSGAQPGGAKLSTDANLRSGPATTPERVGNGTGARSCKKPKSAQPPSLAGMKAVARVSASVFDRELGLMVKVGDATKHHWMTLKLKGVVSSHVADRMLTEIEWPDDETPTRQVVTEARMQEILNSGEALLHSLRAGAA